MLPNIVCGKWAKREKHAPAVPVTSAGIKHHNCLWDSLLAYSSKGRVSDGGEAWQQVVVMGNREIVSFTTDTEQRVSGAESEL